MNERTVNTEIQSQELRIFEAVPGNNLLIKADSPRFTIVAASESYLQVLGKSKAELIGRGTFDAFPSNPSNPKDSENLLASFYEVMTTKKVSYLPDQQYDVLDDENNFITRYWRITNSPVTDNEGNVVSIINSVEEITDKILAEKQVEKIKSLQKAHNLLLQAPMSIQIFKGPELIIELANDLTLKMWDRDESAIGKPFLEVLPELKGEGYELMMQEVIQTGISKAFYEIPLKLNRTGKEELGYYNFYYQPYYEDDKSKATGVLVFSTEVTEQVVTRKKIVQSEQSLELAIEIGELGVFSIHLKNNTATYSHKIRNWFGLAEQHASMEEIIQRIHPDDRPLIEQTIERSFSKEWDGKHDLVFQLIQPQTGHLQYLHSIGQVQFENHVPVTITGILQNVTEQVLARKKIEASENKFRTLVMQAPVAIAVFQGKDLIAEIMNEANLHLINKKREDLIGKPLFESIPELKPFLEPIAHQVMQTGKAYPVTEFEMVDDRYGSPESCYYNSIWEPLRDSEGRTNGLMVVTVDVTEQVLSRRKVEESEQKIRSLIEGAPFPMAVYVGKEMRIEFANQTILDMWGKGKDIIGKKYSEVLPELDNQAVFEQLDHVYTTGIPFHAKHQKIDLKVDEKLKSYYFNYSFTPLFDAQGKVYGVMNTGEDVTDINIANRKVEESRQNLHNIIMQSSVAMCILRGPEHIIEIANDRQLELWGRDRSSVMNKPVLEALPEGKSQGVEDILNHVYTTGETYAAYELPVSMLRNGQMESFYVNVEHRPYREADGRISGIMSVVSEITELVLARHKIEEVVAKRTMELAEVNKALQQNNRELEQFAYVAAHDLQEPLRTISNYVGLFLKNCGQQNTDTEVYTRFILNATSRMQKMIKDLLDFSTIGRNNPFTAVDLYEVLKEAMTQMNHSIQENNAKITSANLPVIIGNAIEMKRLFQNLLSNAIKFRHKEIDPEINISVKEKETEYLFAFKDNGIGIEEQYMAKLFIIFQRLHNATEYPGTGIGLAICKKIVALHGGRIWVESKSGIGSTFYFTLLK
ncbi:MAG: PAS domain-containing protein [Verrucomicrobia bacterium]|nr:PAS domain-containing protein [Prolixibacteraceae bacterium]